MKYLRTVHEHNRPYHSLAIASTKRETITFEVCAVCIRQDSTPMVLLRWNQMKKSNIHILHLVILLSSMSPSPDKNMCLLCCCSARFWEMCFLASEPWKWRTKVTLTTRSWLKLYNSCQTKRWPWRPVWLWNNFKQNVWAPFLLSGASTRGTRDTHTSPQLPLSTIPGSHKNWKLKPTKFQLQKWISERFHWRQGLSFQEYPGILGAETMLIWQLSRLPVLAGPSVPPFKLWTQIHGTSHTACSQEIAGTLEQGQEKKQKLEDFNGSIMPLLPLLHTRDIS